MWERGGWKEFTMEEVTECLQKQCYTENERLTEINSTFSDAVSTCSTVTVTSLDNRAVSAFHRLLPSHFGVLLPAPVNSCRAKHNSRHNVTSWEFGLV